MLCMAVSLCLTDNIAEQREEPYQVWKHIIKTDTRKMLHS